MGRRKNQDEEKAGGIKSLLDEAEAPRAPEKRRKTSDDDLDLDSAWNAR